MIGTGVAMFPDILYSLSPVHRGEGTRITRPTVSRVKSVVRNLPERLEIASGRRILLQMSHRCALLLFIISAVSSSTSAQLPSARLMTLFPAGGQSGTTVDVAATGADLDGVTGIRFSHPGIKGKLKESGDSATDRVFSVSIGADVPPGIYEARIVGRYGTTNPRAFVVGGGQEVVISRSGSASAISLPLNCVANGRCALNAVDSYSLELKQGRRVLIEVSARAIDSRLLPVMTLVGSEGREVARSRREGLIDFSAPSDGVFTLQLHDLLYRGGPEYFYRLCVSSQPHIDSIFPPAGVPGSKGHYTLLGRNLPGSTLSAFTAADGKLLEQLDVQIEIPVDAAAAANADTFTLLGAAGAGVDAYSYRLKSEGGASNPALIDLAGSSLIEEQEPNDSAERRRKFLRPVK